MKHQTDHAAKQTSLFQQIDWFTTLVPFLCILALCAWFVVSPESSTNTISAIRNFLGDEMGSYYLIVGLGVFVCSLYIAFSRFGKIRLGETDKPLYSGFQWGSMIFTAGLAADILFYSCCEWILYASDPHTAEMGALHDWAATYPLFHWGPIPWGFYLVLSAAFGFMLHVRKCDKQKYSEACRPVLGNKVDGIAGKLIDLIAVFALLAGTATTFSLATPLLAGAISSVTGIPQSTGLTLVILVIVCAIYTFSVYFGMKGVQLSAATCTWLFFGLLAYVFFFGGQTRFIIEEGITALGNLTQNFIGLATWTDSLRTSSFPQTWTIFYWAYWMVWCVASPFFIGSISRGRTVRQTILGGYACSVSATFLSFIILGNYSLGLQVSGKLDVMAIYAAGSDLYTTIIAIIQTLPLAPFVLVLLIVAMVAFYATSFDSIALVASSYTYRQITGDEEPHNAVKAFWAILLILLPMALVFSDSSMANLQSVSIIAAFPVAFVILLIIASFLKDASDYLKS